MNGSIIIPRRAGRNHPLRKALDAPPDRRKFALQLALTDALSTATRMVSAEHRMRSVDVIEAMLGSFVSLIQAMAPPAEWGEVSEVIADAFRQRLMVTGDTGEDDYRRKMM